MDLAVGVTMDAAFGAVVNAIVADLLTPFISAIVKAPDFAGLSFTIHGSHFMYGNLINATISFLLVATAVFFFVVKPMNLLISRSHREPPADPTTKKCPECLGEIPIQAKRCMHCSQPIVQTEPLGEAIE